MAWSVSDVITCDAMVVKETESVPGMLLISPQAVMFEPTDSQLPPPPPPPPPPAAAADDDTSTSTTGTACDEATQRDWIIVPMDSISSIMISHNCAVVSARSVTYLLRFAYCGCGQTTNTRF